MQIEIKKIAKFVLSHKQKDGGFSFAKEMPSTIEDTYFALQILYELDIPYKEEDTFEFIKSIEKNNLLAKHIYQISEINKSYKINISWISDIIKKQTLPKELESLYYFVKIDKIKKIKKNELKELNLKIYDDEKLLSNLCYKTIILKKTGIKINEQKIIKEIQDFQRKDGGFGFTKESLPCFIEQIYLAIETLAELNAKPKRIKECIELIDSFKSNEGVYGRQMSTVPSLEATYYAVLCLMRLMK